MQLSVFKAGMKGRIIPQLKMHYWKVSFIGKDNIYKHISRKKLYTVFAYKMIAKSINIMTIHFIICDIYREKIMVCWF